jgi:hypothetical protein
MSWVRSEIYSYLVGFEEVFNMYGNYYMLGLLAGNMIVDILVVHKCDGELNTNDYKKLKEVKSDLILVGCKIIV